jgi:arylsulfatase A-like enzyme
VSAVRADKWKLLEYFEDGRRELYDLEADPGEQTDLAAGQPQRVQALAQKLAAWRREVNARLPQPNPDLKPAANAP